MKRFATIAAAVAVLTLTACSSNKTTGNLDAGSITPISAQKLETTFKRKGIKIEWECTWGSGLVGACVRGDIRAIEVTEYANSFGNSEINREQAFRVAEMRAKAKLRHFIHEDVASSQVKTIMARNVEKANDRVKQRISASEEVAMSDDDPANNTNFAIRENTNNTVQTVTDSIRVNASGILRGVYVKDAAIVDRQTVQVTVRWDKDSERGSEFFRNKWRSR